MKRSLTRFAVIVFAFFYSASLLKANVYVDPRIKHAEACGFVLDPFGVALADAEVTFHRGESKVSAKTDERGYFAANIAGDGYQLGVSAAGFSSAAQTIERVSAPNKECRKPLFVMLQVGEGHSMIRVKKSDLPIAKKV